VVVIMAVKRLGKIIPKRRYKLPSGQNEWTDEMFSPFSFLRLFHFTRMRHTKETHGI
jgi:hypothetical protein